METRSSHLVYLAVIFVPRNPCIYQSHLLATHIPTAHPPTHSLTHCPPTHSYHSSPHPLPPDIIRLTSPRDGQTAVHRAASSDQHEIVSLLLTEDPLCANIQDKEGNTALHLACHKAHKRTVNTLLVRKLELLGQFNLGEI